MNPLENRQTNQGTRKTLESIPTSIIYNWNSGNNYSKI